MSTALVPDPEVEPTITVERFAKAVGLSRAAAYNGVKTGEIPSIKIGHRIVIPTAAARRMLLLDGDTSARTAG